MRKLVKIAQILAVICFCQTGFAQALARYQMEREALGGKGVITCFAKDSAKAMAVMTEAFILLDSLNKIFSDYDRSSEIMAMAQNYKVGHPYAVSDVLMDLMKKAVAVTDDTEATFNVAIGALTKLWRSYLTEDQIPGRCKVAKAKKTLKPRHLKLNEANGTIVFERRGMSLDFGGIAKGYIADQMGRLMSDRGIPSYLINLSGDLVAGAAPPDKEGWIITVAWCNQEVALQNNAVATSGPNYQFFVHKGRRHSHIIDPKTGWGIQDFFSTTVIAPTGWQADAYASALSIMTMQNSKAVIERNPDFQVILGKSEKIYYSNNFPESDSNN